MINLNQKFKPDSEVVITELENEEAVLLHLGTKNYFTLNDTGLYIWQMLSRGLTLGEISEKLQERYEVTHEKAKKSVLNLIDGLITEKLVKVADE